MNMVILAVCGAAMCAADEPGLSRERLESMLQAGDEKWIVQCFRRHPDEVLGFIDEYFEGGLSIVETQKEDAMALQKFRIGLKFAELADRARSSESLILDMMIMSGSTLRVRRDGLLFAEYAASFGSWNAVEQRKFREGQRLVREARGKLADDPKAAAEIYEAAAVLAEGLGDHWGHAMALSGHGRAMIATGDHDAARKSLINARILNEMLWLRSSSIRNSMDLAEIASGGGALDSRLQQLTTAYRSLRDDDDIKLRQLVVEPLLAELEKSKDARRAAEVRADEDAIARRQGRSAEAPAANEGESK